MRNKVQKVFAALAACLVLVPAAGHAAESVRLEVIAAQPVLPAGRTQIVPVKIALTGIRTDGARRTPVNVAIVLDRSGSMSGEKIERAKDAAIRAVELLNPDDIVAVVAYDDVIEVVVPATKAAEREQITRSIRSLYARGNTALFAGVSKGVAEVRKFFERGRVNRVILLSDGMANVGPSSPAELGSLGASFAKDGIAVTTLGLGLGYNEDLMVQLARSSDGNHAFIENANDLPRIFTLEFGDILSVLAQDVSIEINVPAGIRPVRVLGRDASIYGQRVVAALNQVYSGQEKYLMLELEVPPAPRGAARELAAVNVKYADMRSAAPQQLLGAVQATFTDSDAAVQKAVNREALSAYLIQAANAESARAMALRDAGDVAQARSIFAANVAKLTEQRNLNALPELDEHIKFQASQDVQLADPKNWSKQRKLLSKEVDSYSRQQSY